MGVSVLGINHTTASVAFREKVAFNDVRLLQAYESATAAGIHNIIILSTCNRTEVYSLKQNIDTVAAWFAKFLVIEQQLVEQHSYVYTQTAALEHLLRVASGLDSMILGEPQILGQLKKAYSNAKNCNMVNKKFSWLMEQIFAATKLIRTESKLGEQPVSIAFAVTKLSAQLFDDVNKQTLMLVATGEMNQLVAKHMCGQGLSQLILVNRNQSKATALAQVLRDQYPQILIDVIAFDSLSMHLHRADMVCSCTGSLNPVISYDMVVKAIKERRHNPMLLVDLAVPRDIEDRIEELDDVYHYTVDDLQHVLDENIKKRRTASVYAELMVGQQVTSINAKQRLKDLGHFQKNYLQNVQASTAQLGDKALEKIAQGHDAHEVVSQLVNQVTSKLTHTQFYLLQQAAQLEDTSTLDFLVQHLGSQQQK